MENRVKILVLEHDPQDIELLQYELKKGGLDYTPKIVQTKEEYENALINFNPDIILSDYSLPTFDGLTAFQIRQKVSADTPFIFVSGIIGEEKAVELIKNGATDYVLKEKLYQIIPKIHRALKEARDASEIKAAQEQIKASESRLKNAQKIAKLGNWDYDFKNDKLYWSDQIYVIFGLEKEGFDVSHAAFLNTIHPEDRERYFIHHQNLLEGKCEHDIEHRIILPDGTVKYIHEKGELEYDQKGKPAWLHGTAQDVTEKKLAEIAITKSEEKYRSLFHLNPLPMWVCDIETYRFLNVNEAAIRHYGYSREEFLAMTIKDIWPKEDVNKLEDALNANKKTSAFSQGVFRHIKKNGELIHVEIQSNEIDFEGRKALLVIAKDISERVHYLKAIEEQNIKLREIAWMQSHVVRAPLARMMGLIHLLKNHATEEKSTAELFNLISASANELDVIIREIVMKTEQVGNKPQK